jgi:hypothetical protein
MDFQAYAYDPILLHTFRKAVDDAYEQVGDFQDVSVTEQILGAPVRDDVVNQRLIKMNVVLAGLRTQTVRSAMRNFLGSPASSIQTLSTGDTPRLWMLAQLTPNEQVDGVGNAAMLGAGVFNALKGGNIFVSDIFARLCPFRGQKERGRVPWTHTPLARKGEPWKPCRERLYACCACSRTSSASGSGTGSRCWWSGRS